MENLVRREVVETAETIVVKIGTNVLACPDDSLDVERVASLADQIHRIRESGRPVVVVSSGAVGAGMGLLSLRERPRDLAHLQAAAATGQAHLIRLYDDCFRVHGYHAAQILVTGNDFKQRGRYLNVRNTLRTLFEYPVIPIVNENDTVSVDEIKFGDNDHLAAMISSLLPSPLLIILSIIDGLYDGPPGDPASQRIPLVDTWNDELLGLADASRSSRGTGGMASKLQAVRKASMVGENVIIANGTRPGILDAILDGQDTGTLFLAAGQAMPAWKRWIGYTVPPRGRFVLDDGACKAVEHDGRSLLAIGITRVSGEFSKGEVVAMTTVAGREFARGLTNYDSREARMIAGHRTSDIADIIGHQPYAEVIHRDNLVVTTQP